MEANVRPDAPLTFDVPMRGDVQATCPSAIPSGDCHDSSLFCDYVDDKGCPVEIECVYPGAGQGWWLNLIPDPGGACTTPGQVCEYTRGGDGVPQYGALECGSSAKWEKHDLCPATTPAEGSPCSHSFLRCNYGRCPDKDAPIVGADCMPSGQTLSWSLRTFCDPIDGGG